MRWALADAGDGMDDANFETTTANAAILRLTKELAWMEEQLSPTAGEMVTELTFVWCYQDDSAGEELIAGH